ncbi:MAG: CBS domain-containing protein [Thermoleophilaceae bacterium]|nr:CBS domain-containing protein [Thermoleophilaceae bacterium]
MTAPARTVPADSTASEALVAMLDHGVRHLLVLEARRRLIGVIDDVDLMASERRAPFHLRTLVSRSRDAAGVAEAAADLPRTVIALHEAGLAPLTICRMIASIHDTVVRRLIEIAHEELGPPRVPYSWLALGSFGRREPFPGSDVDCALAWDAGTTPAPARPCSRSPGGCSPGCRRAGCVRTLSAPWRRIRSSPAPSADGSGRPRSARRSGPWSRPAAVAGRRGEQRGVGHDDGGGAARGRIRPAAAPRPHAPPACRRGPRRASPDGLLPPVRARVERRAEGQARHKARRGPPD